MEIQKINIKRLRQCIKKLFRTNTNEVGFIHLTSEKLTPYNLGLLWWILSYQSSLLLNTKN
jgi:hypothetical protein